MLIGALWISKNTIKSSILSCDYTIFGEYVYWFKVIIIIQKNKSLPLNYFSQTYFLSFPFFFQWGLILIVLNVLCGHKSCKHVCHKIFFDLKALVVNHHHLITSFQIMSIKNDVNFFISVCMDFFNILLIFVWIELLDSVMWYIGVSLTMLRQVLFFILLF